MQKLLNELTGTLQEKILPYECDDTKLAANFSAYFDEKVLKLMNDLGPSNDDTSDNLNQAHVDPQAEFRSFNEVDSEEVEKFISATKKTFNANDPYPIKDICNANNFNLIIEIFTRITNLSIKSSSFPQSEKVAIVHPLYKGEGDANNYKYYRPVSNLSFLSKIIEKIILKQLHEFLHINNILPENQSAYRPNHSTETCLTAVLNDLLGFLDKGKIGLLFMLDLSAAFDTVNHEVLINDLNDLGIRGDVLKWITEYLRGRSFHVQINRKFSQKIPLNQGVPQGSVLGPILFLLYVRGLSRLFSSRLVPHQQFADDSQGYESFDLTNVSWQRIQTLIMEIKSWLKIKFQKLNEDKTKFMLVGSKRKLKEFLKHYNQTYISLNNFKIKLLHEVKDLGIFLDENLSLHSQVKRVIKSCNHQIRNLYFVKKYITTKCLKMLVVHQILSRIDYCNSIYINLPNYLLRKLQMCMNKAARLIHGIGLADRVTPCLIALHWLPIKARLIYKVCCIVKNTLLTQQPAYLKVHLIPTRNRLQVPRIYTSYGRRMYQYYAPFLYNSLPRALKESTNIQKFKKLLKTHLFSLAYDLENATLTQEFQT